MTTKRRRTANMTERLAAAYIALGLVPEPLRSLGSAERIVETIEADHNILHAFGGDTRPQNLNLLTKAEHKEKTKRDQAIIAKVRRIANAHAEHIRRLLCKASGSRLTVRSITRKGNKPLPCGRGSSWKKQIGKWNAVPRTARGASMGDQTEVHNRIVGDIVRSIVKPPLDAGGSFEDVLVVTESVLTGVLLLCVKMGGDEIVLDKLVEGVKGRLAELRLRDLPMAGEA